MGSEALAETEKVANAAGPQPAVEPGPLSKRSWCSTTELPRQATSRLLTHQMFELNQPCLIFLYYKTTNFRKPLIFNNRVLRLPAIVLLNTTFRPETRAFFGYTSKLSEQTHLIRPIYTFMLLCLGVATHLPNLFQVWKNAKFKTYSLIFVNCDFTLFVNTIFRKLGPSSDQSMHEKAFSKDLKFL